MKSSTNSADSSAVKTTAIILCAGRGERTGLTYNKILYNIGHKTVIETTLDAFSQSNVDDILLVVSPDDKAEIKKLCKPYGNVKLCLGGSTRTESVANGLKAIKRCDIVVIHDGARPFISSELIDKTVQSAIQYGSGILAVPTIDTIKQANEQLTVTKSLRRSSLYNIQTPQTFRYDEIKRAYDNIDEQKQHTDDGEVYEQAGYEPKLVIGSYDNTKITTCNDLVKNLPNGLKIGIGFDVHKLVKNRPLILGGTTIEYEKGLLGHSDADALTHAIMDALLSAALLPDIGVLFPDTDPKYLNASSIKLLQSVTQKVLDCGYTINNVSAVIIAQKPKMAKHIFTIRQTLADAMGIAVDQINVSATTTEMLGIVGRGKAIASSASCLLSKQNATN